MVNYKLSIKEGKQYKEIIWNKDSYARFHNHRLYDIDAFTSQFSDNMALKKELIRIKALSNDDLEKKLSIRYYIKGHISLLQYGLTLKDDIKFFDVNFIKSYLLDSIDDIVLLEKLCNHYRNSYVNGRNVMSIREYINKVINNELENNDIKKIKYVLSNFVDREVYQYDINNTDYVKDEQGNNKIIYKNLHSLAMFLSYDYKKRIQPSIYEKQNPTLEVEKVKVKRKKKDQIPGQYSLFE